MRAKKIYKPADAGDDERDGQVDGDGSVVRAAGFTIVAFAAAEAFYVVEHLGAQQAAPPSESDRLFGGISTVRAGRSRWG